MTDTLFQDEPKPKRRTSSIDNSTPEAQLYLAYPRRKARASALSAIRKALKIVDYYTLMDAVVVYSKSVEVRRLITAGQQEFIPYPATWFNSQSWLDDVIETPATKRTRDRERMNRCFKRVKSMQRDVVEVAIAKIKAAKPHAWTSYDYLDTQQGTDDGKRLCVRVCELMDGEAER